MGWLTYQVHRRVLGARWSLQQRLTPAGRLVALGLALTGLLGMDPEQAVAGQVFALLLCLLVVARAWTWRFEARFSVQRRLPRFGTVGQRLVYSLQVHNQTGRLWRGLEVLEERTEDRPTWPQFKQWLGSGQGFRSFRLARRWPPGFGARLARVKPGFLPVLPPRGQAQGQMELLPLRRGAVRLEAVLVARRDPLGLVRGWVRVAQPQTVLILPKRYPLPPLALPGQLQYQQGGVVFASSVGESEEFVALRYYRPGDPVRHVHWRSSARVGRLVVKEFEDEFFVRHAVVLDTFAPPGQEAVFEEAVSLAASLLCTVQTQESLVDLMFVGLETVCLTTGRGVAQVDRALEVLAGVEPCRDKPFTALQALVLQHAGALSGCLCLLLAWDEPRRELARRLQALGLPLWVWVVADPAQARRIRAASEPDRPEQFLVLQAGQIEAGLRQLEAVQWRLGAGR